ncbi:MAG: Fumarate reductase flavoprotein subunit, partial [Rhodopila sp.]|nr:Fumarate reductase flavoprotein subunit [Rhodopila sp.]
MPEKPNVSRRGFVLTATSAGVAAGTLAAPNATRAAAPQWNREADVVVIGAGAMGLTAAIVAREAGAS